MNPNLVRKVGIWILIALSVSVFSSAQGQSDGAITWSSQAVTVLKADGSGDYPTLEEAVKQAPSGATINLKAGSYRLKSNGIYVGEYF